jgi:hypothetical protein
MEALKRTVKFALISFILCTSFSFGQEPNEPNLPRNIFENDPVISYCWVWWRPYKVIFDREKVLEIQNQIEAISLKDAGTIKFETAFGENTKSAFLFPVLATHAEKGTIILERFLQPYNKGKESDDEWLLIIASLGRIPTPQSQKILEEQLELIIKEWKPDRLVTVKGRQIKVPNHDARQAPLDALIACLAGQKALTAKDIDSLSKKVKKPISGYSGYSLAGFPWTSGLEWARELMLEKTVLKIIEDGLNMCDEKELLKAMDLQASSERLSGIVYFLHGAKDVWPLTEKLLLSNTTFKPEVLDFLIIHYMYILRYKAEIGNGIYPLDERIVRLFTEREVSHHGKLSYISKILLGCKPSKDYPEWQQFLTKHADKLDPAYDSSVETEIKRVHGVTEFGPYKLQKVIYDRQERTKAFRSITQPGVHMYGFRGGRL